MNPTHTLPTNGADPDRPTRRFDGKPETQADRLFFDLRESGYLGPIDQDGNAVADLTVTVTPSLVCSTCRYVHNSSEECWYDACTVCGGPYSIGPSTSDVCVICAQAPTDDEDQDAATAVASASTPAATLRSAALYLDRHGWIQGCYYDGTATVFTPAACTVGAVGMVCYGGPVDAPAQHFHDPGYTEFEAALDWLDRYLTDRHGLVAYDFNDARGRIHAEVTAALRAAADEWDRTHPAVTHVDYAHNPGSLFDCPACQAQCLCTDSNYRCVHCVNAFNAEVAIGRATPGGDA